MADDGPPAAEEAPVTFHVKSSSDARYTLTVPRSMTVLDLKKKLAGAEYSNVPAERQRLIYSGRVLKDPDTLDSYKIKEGNTLHLVKSAASNQPAAGAASSSTAAASSGSGSSTPAPVNLATGPGNNPLAGLTGARYAGLAQLPGAQMFGPDGGMGAPPDAESMATMLSDPAFASTLNEALSNPQVLDMLINQNPVLRDMGPMARQMMRSEEFRRLMTDPNAIRQMTEMSRAMGIGPYGGAGAGGLGGGGGGGGGAFPAPGVTDVTPSTAGGGSNATSNQTNTTTGATPLGNPFLGNPFLSALGMGGGAPSQAAQNALAQNPFAALFNNPALNPATTQPSGSDQPGQQRSSSATAEGGQQQQQQQQPQGSEAPFPRILPPPGFDPAVMQLAALLGANPATGMTPTNANPNQNPPSNDPSAAAAAAAAQYPSLLPFGLFGQGLAGQGGAAAGLGGPAAGGAAGPGGGGAAAAAADTRPPEERYQDQLRQLNEMGFYDFDRNVEALRRTGGNVNGAVEYLLTH